MVNAKLRASKSIAMQAANITLMKWHDKRDDFMFSTSEGADLCEARTKLKTVKSKPKTIIEFK